MDPEDSSYTPPPLFESRDFKAAATEFLEDNSDDREEEDECQPLVGSGTEKEDEVCRDSFCGRTVPQDRHRHRIILRLCLGVVIVCVILATLVYILHAQEREVVAKPIPPLANIPLNTSLADSASPDEPVDVELAPQSEAMSPEEPADAESAPVENGLLPDEAEPTPEESHASSTTEYVLEEGAFAAFWEASAEQMQMQIINPTPHPAMSAKLCHELRSGVNKAGPEADLVYNITKKRCQVGFGGTGNNMMEYTGHRLAAYSEGNTALVFDCGKDYFEKRLEYVTPWLSGYFPKLGGKQPFDMEPINQTQLCPYQKGQNLRRQLIQVDDDFVDSMDYLINDEQHSLHGSHPARRRLNAGNALPLKYMNPIISYDLRRMAIALVGVVPDHPSAQFEKQYLRHEFENPRFTPVENTGAVYKIPIHEYYENGPLSPNKTLDDAVIHFRCGDVLMGGMFFCS